jgi:outer membrane lipoprotein SlyB
VQQERRFYLCRGFANALDALVGSAIGGIVGNRVDAGFVALCEGTIGALKRNHDGAETLQSAVRKSL